MCDENPFYSFEIYKNGELEIVLRSDDPQIITEGSKLYTELFRDDTSPLMPRKEKENPIKSGIDFQLINYGKNCPLDNTVKVSDQRCVSCTEYCSHNVSDKYVKCSGGRSK